jgi:hypothetical protein
MKDEVEDEVEDEVGNAVADGVGDWLGAEVIEPVRVVSDPPVE